MKSEINFLIKKGVYCSWCANLMKKTLNQHFSLEEIKIDVAKARIHIVARKRIDPEKIIAFLKKRGYYLIEKHSSSF